MSIAQDRKAASLRNAASDTKLARVESLLAEGVDPNAADPWGGTALQFAVRYAYNSESEALKIVEVLLAAGADINAADEDGLTPLSLAAIYGYPAILKHLIAAGADVNPRHAEGMTPIAMIEGTPELRGRRRRIITILEKAGGVRKVAARQRTRYPRAIDPDRVGKYPAMTNAGGGFVWDAVLEYRVWCHPERGAADEADGNDYYYAFATYPDAQRFADSYTGAEEPVALILQKEYIDEPSTGKYVHVKKRRMTEWPVEFLSRPCRRPTTIPDFMSPSAPANRLDILRGLVKPPRRSKRKG